MESKMTDKSCADFAAALASKAPVPGGGGAAALAGALGAALCSMVGNFTVGKKKYAQYEDDVKAILAKAEALRTRLLGLADDDAAAFGPLSRAYAIPKDDPTRGQVLEDATRAAIKPPMEMAECCGEAIGLLEELLDKGSVMLLSDVGCGALLCKAAMESAAMNVYVNTASLQDRTLSGTLEGKVDGILEMYVPRADAVAKAVIHRIRG